MAIGDNMSKRKDEQKIKPGILVDKDVWSQFKEKYKHVFDFINKGGE